MGLTGFTNRIVAIIGRNGMGKSTFARCLYGLNKRFKGIVLDGENKYNYWSESITRVISIISLFSAGFPGAAYIQQLLILCRGSPCILQNWH